jgi:hypothetical protein
MLRMRASSIASIFIAAVAALVGTASARVSVADRIPLTAGLRGVPVWDGSGPGLLVLVGDAARHVRYACWIDPRNVARPVRAMVRLPRNARDLQPVGRGARFLAFCIDRNSGPGTILLGDFTTRRTSIIARGHYPAVSPDGRYLVYWSTNVMAPTLLRDMLTGKQ